MSKKHTVYIEEDPVTGDLILPLPEGMCDELGWEIGDTLKFKTNEQPIEKIHVGTQCEIEKFSHVDAPVLPKAFEIPERQLRLLQRILAAGGGGGGSAASK